MIHHKYANFPGIFVLVITGRWTATTEVKVTRHGSNFGTKVDK